MRNLTILIIFYVLGNVFSVEAQASKSFKQPTTLKESILAPEKAKEIQNQIARIDAHLKAIETKKAFVLSSEAETEQATSSGWFDSMLAIQDQLIAKKTKLVNYLKSFDDE